MKSINEYSAGELRRIISIKEQIEALQSRLSEFGGEAGDGAVEGPSIRRRRRMSPAARRKIALAQKARWAKRKAGMGGAAKAPVKRRRMSAAGRARISAAAKARWARVRAGK